MKKIATGLVAATLLITLGACAPKEEVIVETSYGNITKEAFYNELKQANGADVLQKLIEGKVLVEKYQIDDKDLQNEVDKIKAQFPNEEEFVTALANYGIESEAAFKLQVELDLIRFKAVTEDVKVNDDILKEEYEKNKANYQTLKAQHILLETEETAKEVLKKLTDGGDFSALATEFSTDKASAEKGGDLGEFGKGQMVQEFEEAAFSLEANKVSNIVPTQHGFHIIKVNEKIQKSFEEAKDQVKQIYLNDNAKPYEEVMEKLKKDAKIKFLDKELEELLTTSPTPPQ